MEKKKRSVTGDTFCGMKSEMDVLNVLKTSKWTLCRRDVPRDLGRTFLLNKIPWNETKKYKLPDATMPKGYLTRDLRRELQSWLKIEILRKQRDTTFHLIKW